MSMVENTGADDEIIGQPGVVVLCQGDRGVNGKAETCQEYEGSYSDHGCGSHVIWLMQAGGRDMASCVSTPVPGTWRYTARLFGFTTFPRSDLKRLGVHCALEAQLTQ